MAYEVFDDVAFYWFLQVLLGLVLLPSTIYEIHEFCSKMVPKKAEEKIKVLPKYLSKREMQEQKNDVWSLRTIAVCALWVLFLLLLLQLPKFHNQTLTDFNPYEILELEPGSDMRSVKRAYRKMSLKWHPDKNKNNMEEAEQMFIMVNKAYSTLTDDKTRENFEKYGNPDGFQGESVTIGLPSFLTRKSNELKVLIVYFFSMVILVVVVGTWWRWSTRFHKSGVLNDTNFLFWNRLKPKLNLRSCKEVLAGSDEFRELELMMENLTEDQKEDMMTLKESTNTNWNTKDNSLYPKYAMTLLDAHLTDTEVPVALKAMSTYVLKEAPKLLDVMIDMTLQRQFINTGSSLLELKQRVVQGRVNPKSLEQLPYYQVYSDRFDKVLPKHKLKHLCDVTRLSGEELDGLLKDLELTEDEAKNFVLGLQMFPDIQVQHCVRTYDEDNIVHGDLVTVTVTVTRLERDEKKTDFTFDEVMEPPEKKRKNQGTKDYSADDDLSFVDSSIDSKRRIKLRNYESPIVHTLYPFQMREKWVAILDGPIIGVVHTKAIPALVESETIDFNFRARQPGSHKVRLQLKCDSYFGVDQERFITFKVEPNRQEEEESEEEADYEIPDDVQAEPEYYWYYLWGESIWELLLTLFLLYFMFLILISSKFGQTNVQPYINKVSNVTTPLYNQYASPYVNATFNKLETLTTRLSSVFQGDEVEEDDFIHDEF